MPWGGRVMPSIRGQAIVHSPGRGPGGLGGGPACPSPIVRGARSQQGGIVSTAGCQGGVKRGGGDNRGPWTGAVGREGRTGNLD